MLTVSSAGNLHFSYATMADASATGTVYKCVVTNPYLDIKSGGSYTAVTVRRSKSIYPIYVFVLFCQTLVNASLLGMQGSCGCH